MASFDFLYIKFSQASVLLPVIVGIIYYKKLSESFKLLFWFFVLSIAFEVQANIAKVKYGNNLPGLHLFTVVEMFVLSTVFFLNFWEKKIIQTIVLVNFCIFLAVAIVDAFIINGLWQHNTLSRPYSSISLVIYSLVYFYYLLNNDLKLYSWQYPMFWFSIGVLIYFALNVFNFMLDNYFIVHTQVAMIISVYTHALFNIIANSLSARSFRCFKTLKTK